MIIFVREFVDFVDLEFRDDKGVTFSLGVDIEKGEGFVVFVDFIAGDFTFDDLSKNARHAELLWFWV